MTGGAMRLRPWAVNIAGQRFTRLTAIEPAGVKRGLIAWRCRCDCGREVVVAGACLRKGNTKSCGCLKVESFAKVITKHGMCESPEYMAWMAMRSRCKPGSRRKDAKWYASVGVKVCERWATSFEAFLADVGPKPGPGYSLDRIDPYGNYEPGNCRWATWKEQANNKRGSAARRAR